jgi:hypothetical protein
MGGNRQREKNHKQRTKTQQEDRLRQQSGDETTVAPGGARKMTVEMVPPELSEYHMEIEFLFPDGTTHKYVVVGESE